MEYVLLSTVTSAFIILSYTLGLKNGQRIQNNERIELPRIEPIKAIRKSIEDGEEQERIKVEQKKLQEFLTAVNDYTGDIAEQKKVI